MASYKNVNYIVTYILTHKSQNWRLLLPSYIIILHYTQLTTANLFN